MLEKLRFTIAMRKLFKSWGGDPTRPTINEMIIASPIMFISSIRNRSFIFSNKYVCADSILIICAYAIKILDGTGTPLEIITDLKSKTISAIQYEYDIPDGELIRMQKNRFDFFGTLLDDHEDDISPMIEEASLVFAHDLHYNRYVEYTSASPLIIMGIDKQNKIESETLAYFHTALKLVTDAIKQYYR